ncbi:DUF4287 domain-containing protein [bacterium]|nr:DUF4287 domain-containing protein [bacterium]
MEDTMIRNLEEKTGKTLQEWINIVTSSKHEKHKAIVDHLKSEHGLTHGYANLVAHKSLKSDAGSVGSSDDLVAAQYSKGKEELKPIYDKLISLINKFGSDVELAPKKAYVSVRRKKQFAIIQPSTKSRLDIGLNLRGKAPQGRLEPSGSFNAMCSHRIRIANDSEVDQEVVGWIHEAYEDAG